MLQLFYFRISKTKFFNFYSWLFTRSYTISNKPSNRLHLRKNISRLTLSHILNACIAISIESQI